MFEVTVYKDSTLIDGAKIASKNRLYVPGWRLQETYKYFIYRDHDSNLIRTDEIAIGRLHNIPVCIAVREDRQIMAFCRKSLRKKGYASECVKALAASGLYAEVGIDVSRYFWHKLGIPIGWSY